MEMKQSHNNNDPVQEQNAVNSPQPAGLSRNRKIIRWFKRIGVLGFLFFLAKGLVWIAILYGGFRFSGCEGN